LNTPADVLSSLSTGMPDSPGLGISTILIRQRDSDGRLLLPSLLVVHWPDGAISIGYVPFLASGENLLHVRNDLRCQRLD
jgi:hypothetical protein